MDNSTSSLERKEGGGEGRWKGEGGWGREGEGEGGGGRKGREGGDEIKEL